MEQLAHFGQFHIFVNIYLHVFPMATLLVLFFIDNFTFQKKTLRKLMTIGIIYLVWNYIGVIIYNEPIYEFLKWNEIKTPIVIVIVGLVHMGAH